MKAIVMHEYGGTEVLKFEDQPDPVPGPGEVLVRVAAAGINPVDTYERAGATKDWNPFTFPYVLGWDFSGTVIGVGPGVEGFAAGDMVCAWANHTYAELCVVKADLLAKVPSSIAIVDAATLPLAGLTGAQLISVASGVKSGQTVLVSGAAGSVGRSAVYMAKESGASVIAGVLARQMNGPKIVGADQVVALDDESAMAKIPQVDVVANAVGGKTAEMLLAKVKPGGSFVSTTGAPANAKDFPDVRVVAFVSKQDAKQLANLVAAAAAGKLVLPIDRKIPLRDAALGQTAVVGGGVGGKVLLIP